MCIIDIHIKHCVCCLQYSSATQSWLEDAAIRLLCVFALDRFIDFVSDEVKHMCIVNMYSLVNHTHYVLPCKCTLHA